MCIMLLSYKEHPGYPLIVGANRDEFYDRPTSVAAFWADAPGLLAGRDMRAGGTWLGITREGRFAAITNFRDTTSIPSDGPSRGQLVKGFLVGEEQPRRYLATIAGQADRYNGFSIIVGSPEEFCYFSNRENEVRTLKPGLYGLSNHLLDTPWPKVTRGKRMMAQLLADADRPVPEALFAILADRTIADDEALPATGVGLERERWLSPLFVSSAAYGTCSSTVLVIDSQDEVTFLERTFRGDPDRFSTVAHRFRMNRRGSG